VLSQVHKAHQAPSSTGGKNLRGLEKGTKSKTGGDGVKKDTGRNKTRHVSKDSKKVRKLRKSWRSVRDRRTSREKEMEKKRPKRGARQHTRPVDRQTKSLLARNPETSS